MIGGVEYCFVPENRALASVEDILDLGLLELCQRFVNNKQRVKDIAVVLSECSRVGKPWPVLPYEQAFDFALGLPREATSTAMKLVLERYGPPAEGSGEDAGKAVAAPG